MYDDFLTQIPADEDELWDMLWEQFELHILSVLWHSPVETKEDALSNKYHREPDGRIQRDGMHVIRYRNESGEIGQRDYFLEMGRELLPYVHQALDERKLTPEFVQQWGKIMFCHGYIASYVFDDTDDLSNVRKGGGGRKDGQRRWIAHILLALLQHGHGDGDARAIAGRYVRELVAGKTYPPGFGEKWFRNMVDSEGMLAATYDAQHMYRKRIEELVAGGSDGIPPIPSINDLKRFADPN
ncbi:MAG TPA: hypothetical protein VNS02_05730 [Rhizobiaceae bacterium]|nr:hypothetical protein [Rhizobiaceae bacterium]